MRQRFHRCGVLGAALLLSLAACTTSAPSPSGEPSEDAAASATSKPIAEPEATPTVEPVIVVAGVDVDGINVTVSGYVSGLIEDGSECRFVFTGPSGEVQKASTGMADRATTVCGTVTVPTAELASGTWTVRLDYPAGETTVSSEEAVVEVP